MGATGLLPSLFLLGSSGTERLALGRGALALHGPPQFLRASCLPPRIQAQVRCPTAGAVYALAVYAGGATVVGTTIEAVMAHHSFSYRNAMLSADEALRELIGNNTAMASTLRPCTPGGRIGMPARRDFLHRHRWRYSIFRRNRAYSCKRDGHISISQSWEFLFSKDLMDR